MSAPGHRQSPFPIVMRGYDRDQVTDHLRRLEAELRMMAADRDSAHANSDELQGHLDDARRRIRDLQDEVDKLSVPPTTVAGMTDRISRMLQLATDESSELRATARDEAAETLSVARQEAEDIRAAAASASTRTKELAQEHADSMITDAEKRAAEIDEAAKAREA
ncbi:DivIVA domain-containing protein, partial [Gordonia sp. (in: high G+C Gram-positive bacteria)]